MIFDFFDSPELLDIQRTGFYRFLKEEIPQLLAKEFPIKALHGNYEILLCLNKNAIKLIAPEDNPRDCILKMKTYSCKLYAQVKVVCKRSSDFRSDSFWEPDESINFEESNTDQKISSLKQNNDIVYESLPEWVLLGQLPMMTKRGHFIINGSPRVIVHQVVRSPGIYFQKLVKKDDQNRARFYGDIIPLKGVWVRLQMTKKGRVEAKFKKGKKVEVELLQKCLQVIESQTLLESRFRSYKSNICLGSLEAPLSRLSLFLAPSYKSSRFLQMLPFNPSRTLCSKALFTGDKKQEKLSLKESAYEKLLSKKKGRAESKAEHDAFVHTYDKLYRTTQDKELEEWQKKKRNQKFFKEKALIESGAFEVTDQKSFYPNKSPYKYKSTVCKTFKPCSSTSIAGSSANKASLCNNFTQLNGNKNSATLNGFVVDSSEVSTFTEQNPSIYLGVSQGLSMVLKNQVLQTKNTAFNKFFSTNNGKSYGLESSKQKKMESFLSKKEKMYGSLSCKKGTSSRSKRAFATRKPENSFKRKRCSEALFATFKSSARYSLGRLGREKINDRFGLALSNRGENFVAVTNVRTFTNSSSYKLKRALTNLRFVRPYGVSNLRFKKPGSLEPRFVRPSSNKSPICKAKGVSNLREQSEYKSTYVRALTYKASLCSRRFVQASLPVNVTPSSQRFVRSFVRNVNLERTSVYKNEFLDKVYTTQLTSLDLCYATIWLYRLRKGEESTDDIDHSQNRRVRTSGELLQTQFENGVYRLKNLLSTKLQEWKGDMNASTFSALFKKSYKSRYNPKLALKGFCKTKANRSFRLGVNVTDPKALRAKFLWKLRSQSSEKPGFFVFAGKCKAKLCNTSGERKWLSRGILPPVKRKLFDFVKIKALLSQKKIVLQSKTRRSANKASLWKPRFPLSRRERNEGDQTRLTNLGSKEPRNVSEGFASQTKRLQIEDLYNPLQIECTGYKAKLCTAKDLLGHVRHDRRLKVSIPTIKELFSTKPITGALREFFGSNPLSQYMDQTNPLAEITHKRRLSSLGLGGVSRESAGMAIRGIHPTHFGRICPIETPEGKNAGLVNSLAFYTKVDETGFLKTPYYRVFKGQIQASLGFSFCSAKEESDIGLQIAPSDLQKSSSNTLRTKVSTLSSVPVRVADNFLDVFKKENPYNVQLIAISPIQMISVATSLIPFLEHNDANRALMGSNMQRQAVPLMISERPVVGTGLESTVIVESGHITESQISGFASHVTANQVVIDRLLQNPSPGFFGNPFLWLNPYLAKEGFRTQTALLASFSQRFVRRCLTNLGSKEPGFLNRRFVCSDKTELLYEPIKLGKGHVRKSPRFQKEIKCKASLCFPLSLWKQSFYFDEVKQLPPLRKPLSFTGGVTKLRFVCSVAERSSANKASLCYRNRDDLRASSGGVKHKALQSPKQSLGGLSLGYVRHAAHRRLKIPQPLLSKLPSFTNLLKKGERLTPQKYTGRFSQKKEGSFLHSTISLLTTFSRSNQNTSITEKPLLRELDWVQKGDILTDCSASNNGELAVGKNVLLAYIPWEGYNFEDAIVISDRLVREHVYTSLHIERYVFQAQDLKEGAEWFTKHLPGVKPFSIQHLEESGLPKIGSFLKEGDIIVGKIRYLAKKPSSPYERLLCDILGEKNFAARNKSLYVPKGVSARVICHKVISAFENDLENKVRPPEAAKTVHIFLGEKRVIQVGDKISGRHGNKGVISTILPRQDMPYLPDGTPIDLILNPLGVPSRMNVGQVLECLLGLAASYLNSHFKIAAFDEKYGVEASKSIVFLKLYQARLMSGQNWLFQVSFPGKTRLVDGRSGECFDQWITVGKAYILKLIHMVSEKIHARSTGPYALITQQPLRGRSNKGGQRLGEMEVWALEGFGAAYTLQELLTKKSDDFFGRKQIVDSILPNPASIIDRLEPSYRIAKGRDVLGHPEIFKVLLCELQALCLDLGVYIVTPESFQRTFLGVVH